MGVEWGGEGLGLGGGGGWWKIGGQLSLKIIGWNPITENTRSVTLASSAFFVFVVTHTSFEAHSRYNDSVLLNWNRKDKTIP